jgi:hypothetical protein
MSDDPVNMIKQFQAAMRPTIDENSPINQLSRAWDASKGKVQGGESSHHHSGTQMSREQMQTLIANFTKAGRSRDEVIRALQGSGYDTSGL